MVKYVFDDMYENSLILILWMLCVKVVAIRIIKTYSCTIEYTLKRNMCF